jgi:tRNA pseudouridine55 synthase
VRERIKRRPVHGVLLLDKPKGLSSNDALQKAKWLLRAEKAGHTGTLDPLATGLLPLCFGAATKFSQLHLDADKRYEAIAALGVRTTTGDAEGDVIERRDVLVNNEMLQSVLHQFKGEITQVPPMYSALKKDGKALYEYARAGLEVERIARKVCIHSLTGEIIGKLVDEKVNNKTAAGVLYAYDAIKLIVLCSKGTYIRTLGEDIGEQLGCGAHLSSLRRIGTGGFDVSQCVTLEALEAMSEQERLACLLPVESLLDGHERVTLDAENAARFLNGVRRRGEWQAGKNGLPVAVFGSVFGVNPAVLLGTAQVISEELVPGRLLSLQDIEQILSKF